MSTRVHSQTVPEAKTTFSPVPTDLLQRAKGPGCMEDECRRKRQTLQRASLAPRGRGTEGEGEVPPIVYDVLRSPGQPLDKETRNYFETRFGHDFSKVRVHTDAKAAESARAVNARAYTVGRDVVFGSGQYAPANDKGQKLLAHELTHTIQQGKQSGSSETITDKNDPTEQEAERLAEALVRVSPDQLEPENHRQSLNTLFVTETPSAILSRDPVFPDSTCDRVRDNIMAAWPIARHWVRNAESRLANPRRVASALGTHFKIDPNNSSHASDLQTVRSNLNTMLGIFGQNIDQLCTPANQRDECHLPDGGRYAAFVDRALPNTITHCLPSAERGLLGRESLIETIVHEVAHLVDPSITDYAYRHESVVTTYTAMTRQQAIENADSYSELCKELFGGPTTATPLLLGVGTGVLLSTGQPRWAITAAYDIRSRSGLEVFDLVGGLSGFIALDVGAPAGEPVVRDIGAEVNLGVISRSAETQFLVDTRIGAFVRGGEQPMGLGMSVDTLIGWGDSRFRTGINVRMLFDFLRQNHAVIIGGEFRFGP